MARTRRALMLVALVATAIIPNAVRANPPGFSLSIAGPATNDPGVPATFSGVLSVATVGVPLISVELRVDGNTVATATTDVGGGWSASHTFTATLPFVHTVQAVALSGTPLETQSDTVMTTTLAYADLVVNEVDYDQPGFDPAEFIEIYNPSSSPSLLDGLAVILVNGAANTEYLRVDLTGFITAGGYAVVSSAGVVVPAGVPQFVIGNSLVQNGAPDGIALMKMSSFTLMDALSYEGSIVAAIISGAPGTYNLVEGSPAVVTDSGLVSESMQRLPNGADTQDASLDWNLSPPTPGSANA